MQTASDIIQNRRTDDVARVALDIAAHPQRRFIMQQIDGWQRLRHKVPLWAAHPGLLYPHRLALEQCSGQPAATYKARLARRLLHQGGTFIDLTGGFGVDFFFIAQHFQQIYYIERQPELVHIARHNLSLLGLKNVAFNEGNAEEFLRSYNGKVDLTMLDPARRDSNGRKTIHLSDCEPNALALFPLLMEKSRYTFLKLSPMLDITMACRQLDCVREVHVFSNGGECKELLLLLASREERDGSASLRIYATEDGFPSFIFTREEEAACSVAYVDNNTVQAGMYLFDPSPALLKAGALKLPAVRFGLCKLHPDTHLYVGQNPENGFPGRMFRIVNCCGLTKGELRAAGCATVRRAHLATRGFPQPVASLRRQLGIAEGGTEYWFATTLAGGYKRLIRCERITEV